MSADAGIQQALKLTEEQGYTRSEWLRALNLVARDDPKRLQEAAAILAALADSPTRRDSNSKQPGVDSNKSG